MKQVTLSAELEAKVVALQANGKTFNETLEQVIKLGTYQLAYRREANKGKAAEQKQFRAIKKSHPELFETK